MTLRILCASSLLALSAVTPSLAQAAIKHEIDIPAQTLGAALAALAQQTRIQLVYPTELVEGQQAKSLSGSMTPEDALRVLLEQSRLRFEFLDAQTVTLMPSSAPAPASAPTAAPSNDAAAVVSPSGTWNVLNRGLIRLAQSNDTQSTSSTGGGAPGAAASNGATGLEQIVVTGSRIGGTGVRAAPVVTFTREKLDELGVTQVADVLSYLPQQSFQVLEGDTFAGARPVQLRGLGLGTTLVLVNGRRTVTSALQGARSFFDLSMLPLAAVERIEVLANSASAIYGADAIGGVLNVVLKDHVEAPTLDLQASHIRDGGDERQASFTIGASGERFKSMLVLDFLKRDALYGYQRDYTANMDYRRFGGTDQRGPRRNPGNVCSANGSNLPGLTASCAGVPTGSTGIGLTPADFLATAGVLNLGSPYDYWSLVPSGRRASANATGEFAFTNEVTGFGELMYIDRVDTRMDSVASLSNAPVPASNPYNPFGVPVLVNYRMDPEAFGNRDEPSNTEAWRAVAGVKGAYESWSWEASALYGDERADNTTHNGLNTSAALAALAQTDPALALNPFVDGPAGSASLLQSIKDPGALDTFRSQMLQLSQFVRRSLISLPAGDLQAVLGAEERREKLNFNSIYLAYPLVVDRDVYSGFLEFRVPLLGNGYTKPWARELTFTTSARYDDYNDIGGTFNPQYGLVWRPAESWLLRGSYSKGFRAPSLFELYQPLNVVEGSLITDPRRNETVPARITSGGDENLQPEKSTSYTAGLVLTPTALPNFTLSATYWSVKQDQRVVRTYATAILANEAYFPERVVRASPTPADIAAGRPGQLLALLSTNLNAGSLETSGVDLELSQMFKTPWGRFTPTLNATWVESFVAADFPSTPFVERVSSAQYGATIPRWRLVGSLAWSHGPARASLTARHVAPYDDADTAGVRNGRTVSPPTLWDLQASVDLGTFAPNSSALSGTTLRLGAINLFDKMPDYSASGSWGYDTSTGDLRGRVVYLKATKAFQ